jgi:hypothetical protein
MERTALTIPPAATNLEDAIETGCQQPFHTDFRGWVQDPTPRNRYIDMGFRDGNRNPVGRLNFDKAVFAEKVSNRPKYFCPVPEIFLASGQVGTRIHAVSPLPS